MGGVLTVEGVDYSWSRPAADCLFNQGYRFAFRYLGDDDTGENITKTETDRLHAAGLKVAVVWQTSRDFMVTGSYDEGFWAAKFGGQQASAAGMPDGRPIYFSLDTNPNVLTAAQWKRVEDWLLGAATVLGVSLTGVYGAEAAINRLVPTFAAWGWQTAAWSDSWSPKARVRQHTFNVTRCGGNVDINTAVTADYGAW